MRAEAQAVLDRLGHGDIPVTRAVGRLPAAGKQIVSMARALSHEARLIVMDEPSAVLAHDEVANLFRVVRAGRLTAEVRPSLSTVTRSPISRISSSRCEM